MLNKNKIKLKNFLHQEAKKLGFTSLAITNVEKDKQQIENLKQYLEKNYHGQMSWLNNSRRGFVKNLWQEAQSVIIVAMNYTPAFNPLEVLQKTSKGAISVYAQNRDYHEIIKGKLKTLGAKFLARARQLSLQGEIKVFVDTAPLMEKPLAMRAGLGWQGKHTNLVSKKLGSWFFLGSIITTLELPVDEKHQDHCGSCKKCLSVCPTNAFPAPYQLDSRLCISYLTIEHNGLIDESLMAKMGNRIYGCDDCLAVCPWNKFAKVASEIKLLAKGKQDDLFDLLKLNDVTFRKKFSASPIKRIGRDRFIRNCLIAAGNSKNKKLKSCIENLCYDKNEIISQTAKWALKRYE